MKILTLLLAAAVGALQVWLDVKLYGAVFSKNYGKCAVLAALKLAVYAAFLLLLFRLLQPFVLIAAVGYAVGFFPPLLIYTFLQIKKK